MTIIGIDHGYGMMKTANTQMLTGVSCYQFEPHTTINLLEWNGKHYICGTFRQPIEFDKTVNENYFILTLAAICRELRHRNEPCVHHDISLAVGLPLTRITHERNQFLGYLRSFGDSFDLRYEGKRYIFSIKRIDVYPQGYAAFVTHKHAYKDHPSIILADCGSWTIDAMRIDKGIPNTNTCTSFNYGTIRLMNLITEHVRRRTHGSSISEPQIEQVLRLENSLLENTIQDTILECAEKYAAEIVASINESGLDIYNMPVVWMGGGAAVMKNFAKSLKHMGYIEDIRANARGYEVVTKAVAAKYVQAAV